MKPPRERLRTSQEAHARIRWDERLASRPFVLVVENRPAGSKEIAFGAFVPGGDIPWHRVRQIRLGERVVWCREQRIDVLDELAELPAGAQAPLPPPAPLASGLVPLVPHAFDGRGWTPGEPEPAAPGPALRVATYNVLCDAFDADVIDTARRNPTIVDELGSLDADLIGLSEVTPSLVEQLLASRWARGYALSDGPQAASVRPHGQLLLSRWPIRSAAYLPLTATRRALRCEVAAPWGPLLVVVVHLASNATKEGPKLRREELARVGELLAGAPSVVLMGDFNLDEHELATEIAAAGLRDAWREILPSDPGDTYHPERNALAALFSRDGRAKRYDRVLLRGGLEPCAARLFGTGPVAGGDAGLFPSDHFGVSVDLRRQGAQGDMDQAQAVVTTALVLLPPPPIASAIDAWRARHDKGFGRWMPHVTLLYGFVPEHHFPEALPRIAEACRSVAPFRVTFDATGRFDHGGSSTLWLDPRTDGALPRLWSALAQQFRSIAAAEGRGFTPHLTVARFPKNQRPALMQLERELQRSWKPASFEAAEVHLLARRGEQPFESLASVALGTGEVRSGIGTPGQRDPWAALRAPDEERAPEAQRRRAAASALVEELARDEASRRGLAPPWAEPMGSALMTPEVPDSDLDLVLLTPAGLGAADALRAVHAGLVERGHTSRLALDARHPALRADVEGVPVDVIAAELRGGDAPGPVGQMPPRAFDGMPEPERFAVLGVQDTLGLLAALGPERERWAALLIAVKAWASARALRGQWAGYPGGMSWAILAARTCLDNPGLRGSALLAAFFARWASWPWPRPVAISDAGEPPEATGLLPVVAPCPPWRDTARTVCAPTMRALIDELRRAGPLAASVARHQAAAGELLAPASAAGSPALRVRLDAPKPQRQRELRGLVERSFLALLRSTEALGELTLRPFARWDTDDEGRPELPLGLGPISEDLRRRVGGAARAWAASVAAEIQVEIRD